MTELIKTKRLTICYTKLRHFEDILQLRSDPDVQRFTTQGPQSREDVARFMETILLYQQKHGHGMGSVFLNDSDKFIGQAGIFHIGHYDLQPEIEIGYRFHKKYWGQGYATEVTKALVDWGFKHLHTNTIVSFVEQENMASKRVLEKCGFQLIGLEKCYYGLLEKYEVEK